MKVIFFLLFGLLSSCSKEQAPTGAKNEVRVALAADPSSTDPRLVRDLPTVTLLKLLYEGLTRSDAEGEAQLALAINVALTEDQKTYTFKLRPSIWSDGSPLTATDFEETWKSTLAPDFPAPNAYQLFIIKNAKEIKDGQLKLDELGVKALSPDTLMIQLKEPCPYFLQLLSCYFFFPVHTEMRSSSASNPLAETPSNGPFKFSSWKPRDAFVVEKNSRYWDSASVFLEQIAFQILDENTALQLFLAGKLDWAGSPLSTLPQDAVAGLKAKSLLKISPGAGTQWFRFNTESPPFNDVKMRKAFSLALNRQEIAEHVTQGGQAPAIGIIPPVLGVKQQHYFKDHDVVEAKRLFEASLSERREASGEETPLKVVLRYAANDRNHKIAQTVQQQWNAVFGNIVELGGNEMQLFLNSIRSGTYQIALGSWFADIRDPINFLEIFQTKSRATNQTFWESPAYQAVLERSSRESDPQQRAASLAQAEEMLIDAMPIAPLLHSSYNYLVTPRLKGVYFSELGTLDFKTGTLQE